MTPVAAVDIGTNSVRLLVADVTDTATLQPLDRRMHITRLGQGVDATHQLAPDAIDRTLTVLREYRDAIDDSPASTRVRVTATSAARDATNRDRVLHRRPRTRSASNPSSSPATRKPGCPSPAPPQPSPTSPPRTSSSTSAAAPPSSPSAPPSPTGDLHRRRLRADHRAVPPHRPAGPRRALRRGADRP